MATKEQLERALRNASPIGRHGQNGEEGGAGVSLVVIGDEQLAGLLRAVRNRPGAAPGSTTRVITTADGVVIIEQPRIPLVRWGQLAAYVNQDVYGLVVEWEVSPETIGELGTISLISNNAAETEYRLNIASKEQFGEAVFLAATLDLDFITSGGNELQPNLKVKVEARSVSGVAITVNGVIVGTEQRVTQ